MGSERGPPIQTFSLEELEERINTLPNGKQRTPQIKLEECDLMRLVQYNCDVSDGKKQGVGGPVVVCKPFLRLFRK